MSAEADPRPTHQRGHTVRGNNRLAQCVERKGARELRAKEAR